MYWAGFSNPCSNVFKPYYVNGPKVPANYATGTSTYSADSPWWLANRVKLLCDLNHTSINPSVRGVFDATERWEMQRQTSVEADARKLFEAGKGADAVKLLQEFVNGNCERVGREYRMLNQTLPDMLEAVGIRYMFTGAVKDWTAKSRVPLPLE